MFGIPYMGGKGSISKPIVDYILNANPKCKYVYDLFGGGGAISFEFLGRPQIKQVFYNELNTGVVELLKKIITDGVTPEFYKWVTKEEFYELKFGNSWFSGLVKTCWSFGNNQRDYLYSKENTPFKQQLHDLIVNCIGLDLVEDAYGVNIPTDLLLIPDVQERRFQIMRIIKKAVKGKRIDIQH